MFLPELISLDIKTDPIQTLVIPVCEDRSIHDDRAVAALCRKAMGLAEFGGKKDESLLWYDRAETSAQRILFLGLGPADKLTPEILRATAGTAVKKAMDLKTGEIALVAPAAAKMGMAPTEALSAWMEGACLANHLYDRYKTTKKITPLARAVLLVKPETAKSHAALPRRVADICAGTILAREWVTLPANEKRPPELAALIARAAEAAGLSVTTLTETELTERGFNSLMAVAQASDAGARLVVMEYRHPQAKRTVALVGKGVTFDSGGMNMKSEMGNMKMDMGGAAAVAATIVTAARLGLPLNIVAATPIVENMISGGATRTGDVVTTHAGKTVEINNTDAEGRLILIDAMSHVIDRFHPDVLIDMATLTGACVVALGEGIAGLFSPDAELRERIQAIGDAVHERCWPLPLPDDYRESLKSDLADLSNVGKNRWGGAITAALFLSEFTKDTRWAHIDIAGTAFTGKDTPYCRVGGTGFGVRLLCRLLEELAGGTA